MLLSILIHELGHALAFRYYGIRSHIVLYHFGGLAIPDSQSFGGYSSGPRNPWHDVVISAAGPAAQLVAAFGLTAILRMGGHSVPLSILQRIGFSGGEPLASNDLYYFVAFFLIVSIFWAFLNLLPVYPLDGGQIARNLFLLFGGQNAIQHSLMLSIVAGALNRPVRHEY